MSKSILKMSSIKSCLPVIVILLVAVILLAYKLLIWGAMFLTAGLIVLGIQQLIQLNIKASRFEDNISGLEEKNQGLSALNEKLMEEIRLQKEHSLESGPEEFAWIMDPIRENMENTIRIMFKGICSNIRIAELADNSFVPLEAIKLARQVENKIEIQRKIYLNINE